MIHITVLKKKEREREHILQQFEMENNQRAFTKGSHQMSLSLKVSHTIRDLRENFGMKRFDFQTTERNSRKILWTSGAEGTPGRMFDERNEMKRNEGRAHLASRGPWKMPADRESMRHTGEARVRIESSARTLTRSGMEAAVSVAREPPPWKFLPAFVRSQSCVTRPTDREYTREHRWRVIDRNLF